MLVFFLCLCSLWRKWANLWWAGLTSIGMSSTSCRRRQRISGHNAQCKGYWDASCLSHFSKFQLSTLTHNHTYSICLVNSLRCREFGMNLNIGILGSHLPTVPIFEENLVVRSIILESLIVSNCRQRPSPISSGGHFHRKKPGISSKTLPVVWHHGQSCVNMCVSWVHWLCKVPGGPLGIGWLWPTLLEIVPVKRILESSELWSKHL